MKKSSEDASCHYCGDWNECRDHMVPHSFTSYGISNRVYKGRTVPCCHLCNQLKGSRVFYAVEDIAAHLQERYRKKFKRVLRFPVWENHEIERLDYTLRSQIERGEDARRLITAKLANLDLVQSGLEPVPLRTYEPGVYLFVSESGR